MSYVFKVASRTLALSAAQSQIVCTLARAVVVPVPEEVRDAAANLYARKTFI